MRYTTKLTRSIIAIGLPLAAALLAGCPPTGESPDPSQPETRPGVAEPDPHAIFGPSPSGPRPGNGGPDEAPRYQIIVSLRTMTVLVPAGRLEQSAEFWPLLDEAQLGLIARELLEKNGFRVGVGRPELLDQIKNVLIKYKSLNLTENNVAMLTGDPVILNTTEHPKGQVIFLTTADGTLSGLRFPKSANMFRVACRIRPPKLEDVIFDAVPEIRYRRRRRRLVPTPGGMRQQSRHESRLLMPVRFTLTVPKGHFFVIGPSARAAVKLTAGHQFLRRMQDGKAYDILILLGFAVVRREIPRPS